MIKLNDKVRLKRIVDIHDRGMNPIPAGVTGTVVTVEAEYDWALSRDSLP